MSHVKQTDLISFPGSLKLNVTGSYLFEQAGSVQECYVYTKCLKFLHLEEMTMKTKVITGRLYALQGGQIAFQI